MMERVCSGCGRGSGDKVEPNLLGRWWCGDCTHHIRQHDGEIADHINTLIGGHQAKRPRARVGQMKLIGGQEFR